MQQIYLTKHTKFLITEEQINMNLELNNKIVLITGGSQGIGKATALSMVKEDAKTIFFMLCLTQASSTFIVP